MTPIHHNTANGMPSQDALIIPDWNVSESLVESSGADINLCWTCGTCDNGCPVNISTSRLHPQRNVRMAIYGMRDELLSMPDIWYCLSCRQCLQGCPNHVRPYELHQHLRMEAISRGFLPVDFINAYRKLFSQFQRVRWRAAAYCFKEELGAISDNTWYSWLRTPFRKTAFNIIKLNNHLKNAEKPKHLLDAKSQLCFTCSECSGCCPIMGDRDVFDPKKIIRMVNLGLLENILHSPAIWLCLGCRRCSDMCSQTVRGYAIIQQLKQLAIDRGIVDPFLPIRLLEADRIIYPKFLDEIDALFGLYKLKV